MQSKFRKLVKVYPKLDMLDEQVKSILEQQIRFKSILSGEIVGAIDSGCSDLLWIMKGYMKIEKLDEDGRVMKLYDLGPGEICHEALSCHMSCENLHLTGQAVTDMEVALLPLHILDEYILHDANFMRFVYSNLYDKFRKMVLSKEEIIHESISNRLIQYLTSRNSQTLYVTHQEIADELGTAREVVSKNLKKLEKSGAICLERNKIKIIDKEMLFALKR